ncbi:hypothetical protein LPN04_14030 [Rugamonas sp. A1-17]|nr:hypothetical protein [Rugamonas sp. A1-17]
MDSLITIGTKTDKKPYSEHRWITDLIFYESPILSLFKGSRDQDYFYYWCENDIIVNRWLVIPVGREDIERYLAGEVSLYSLVNKNRSVAVLDMNKEGEPTFVFMVPTEQLPYTYIPPETSFFDADLCPSESYKYLISELYVIDIDKRWFFDEFSQFEKLFTQLYSFVYTVDNAGGIVSSERVQSAFSQYPWRGGFSAVNFYQDLRKTVPSLHEPEVKFIEYHSPGEIKLELLAPVAEATGRILNAIFDNRVALKGIYNDAHSYLRNSGLLKIDGPADAPVHLTDVTKNRILEYFQILAREMNLVGYADSIWELSQNPLIAIKILLSFYRRAEKLNRFQEVGKLSFPR